MEREERREASPSLLFPLSSLLTLASSTTISLSAKHVRDTKESEVYEGRLHYPPLPLCSRLLLLQSLPILPLGDLHRSVGLLRGSVSLRYTERVTLFWQSARARTVRTSVG